MINLTDKTKKNLIDEAKSMSDEDIKRFTNQYLSRYKKVGKNRGVRFKCLDIENVCDFAKEIDGLFIMTKKEQEAFSRLSNEPIEVEFEEDVYREEINKNYLGDKTREKIENFLNTLISQYNGLNKYRKAIAFIYNYMVESGLDIAPVSINDIKNKFFNFNKENKYNNNNNNFDTPDGKGTYIEEDIPF